MVLNPEVPARPAVYGLDHAALDGWKLRLENRGVAVEGAHRPWHVPLDLFP